MQRLTRLCRLVFIVVIVTLANAGTYWFLCRPDLQMRDADPAGFRYMTNVFRSVGGITALSPWNRCLIHFAFTTLVIFAAFALGVVASRRWKGRRAT